jgi:hypothetical protein
MSLDWVQDFGGYVCRVAVASPRCYDPSVMMAVGTAGFAAALGILMGMYFASKAG